MIVLLPHRRWKFLMVLGLVLHATSASSARSAQKRQSLEVFVTKFDLMQWDENCCHKKTYLFSVWKQTIEASRCWVFFLCGGASSKKRKTFNIVYNVGEEMVRKRSLIWQTLSRRKFTLLYRPLDYVSKSLSALQHGMHAFSSKFTRYFLVLIWFQDPGIIGAFSGWWWRGTGWGISIQLNRMGRSWS